MAASDSLQSRVEPSASLNRNVTVPFGVSMECSISRRRTACFGDFDADPRSIARLDSLGVRARSSQ